VRDGTTRSAGQGRRRSLPTTRTVKWMWPGIKQLNKLRNKFAHQLDYQLTKEDVMLLFEPCRDFEKYVVAFTRKAVPSGFTPIDVVEAFANFVAQMLRLESMMKGKLDESIAFARKEQ
jgi:hypothetical protein